MDIKNLMELEVEQLTASEILDSENLGNLLGGCGINSGWGSCGAEIQ